MTLRRASHATRLKSILGCVSLLALSSCGGERAQSHRFDRDDAVVELMLDRGVVRFVDDAKSELNARLRSAFSKREEVLRPMEWKVLGQFQFVAEDGKKVRGDLFLPWGMVRVGKQAKLDLGGVKDLLVKASADLKEVLEQ